MTALRTTRREVMVRWLPAAVIGLWRWAAGPLPLLAMGAKSMPDGVHQAEGPVAVNDQAVVSGAPVASGDTVSTGPAGRAVVILDRSVYLIREQTRLVVTLGAASNAARAAIRVFNGRLLSVFGGGRHQISTETAVIGIRGSGIYLTVDPGRTYACTCYGTAVIQAIGEPGPGETVRTRHHEAPRFIYGPGHARRITPAPVMDHTDAELILLEAMVGRSPPFAGSPDYRY